MGALSRWGRTKVSTLRPDGGACSSGQIGSGLRRSGACSACLDASGSWLRSYAAGWTVLERRGDLWTVLLMGERDLGRDKCTGLSVLVLLPQSGKCQSGNIGFDTL